jgi:hypothetical protein
MGLRWVEEDELNSPFDFLEGCLGVALVDLMDPYTILSSTSSWTNSEMSASRKEFSETYKRWPYNHPFDAIGVGWVCPKTVEVLTTRSAYR